MFIYTHILYYKLSMYTYKHCLLIKHHFPVTVIFFLLVLYDLK